MSTITTPAGTGARRGAWTASPRTAARTPLARPVRGLTPGHTRTTASCSLVVPAARPRVDIVTGLKVSLVAVVALVGAVASGVEFASWAEPDPAVEYVAGDPAWAHVARG